MSRSTCAQAGGSGSPSDVSPKRTKSSRAACGSWVVCSAFQSASASMRRLIQFWAGASVSCSTATTSSANGTAAGAPMPPRRRVRRIRIQALGSANSANQAIPFGRWSLEWWAISCASTTRTAPSENVPSTIVLHRTTLRDGPSPIA